MYSKSAYVVSDVDLIGFRRGEKQFLKWIQELEKRLYKNDQEIIDAGNRNTIYDTAEQMCRIESYINAYWVDDPKIIAQDRFAWTVFAADLMKGHKERHVRYSCSTKLCLLLLLWSSYYLKFSHTKEVQELLRHIIFCTKNLKFMFSFLPGMSMTSYILNFVTGQCDEEDLCKEFFVSIEETSRLRANGDHYFEVYQFYSPLLFYFVENMTSFHSGICKKEFESYRCSDVGKKFSFTLQNMLNKALVYQKKYTLLSMAVDFRDANLVKLLLQLGASANSQRWDPQLERFITVEQVAISKVNSLIYSRIIFSLLAEDSCHTIKRTLNMIDAANQCGILVHKSLLFPKARKSDSVWREKNWRYELHKDAADAWGVDYTPKFPSLRHITKIAIRQYMLRVDKKRLPDAIADLPLPGPLKSYLNLLLD